MKYLSMISCYNMFKPQYISMKYLSIDWLL